MIVRIAAILLSALFLAGCGAGQNITSIAGGEAKVFEPPPYAVLGKTRYDQNWIDSQVEGGVAAFGWPRPKARPASLDAPRRGTKAAPVAAKPVKKPGVFRRIKERILPAKKAAQESAFPAPLPVDATPVIPAGVARQSVATSAPPAPKPRDDVDELLDPTNPPKSQARRP